MLFIPYPDIIPPHSYQPLLKLGWTLEYEIFFYIAAGCLFFVDGMRRTIILCSLFLLLMSTGHFFFSTPSLMQYYANLNLLPFMFGGVIGYLAQQSRLHELSSLAHGCVYAITAIAIVAFTHLSWQQTGTPWGHIVMSIASALIVLSGLLIEGSGRLVKSYFLKLAGDASYSIYLAHMFFVAGVWAVGNRMFHPAQFGLLYLAISTLAIAAGLGAGIASYLVLERPLLKLSGRHKRLTLPAV